MENMWLLSSPDTSQQCFHPQLSFDEQPFLVAAYHYSGHRDKVSAVQSIVLYGSGEHFTVST